MVVINCPYNPTLSFKKRCTVQRCWAYFTKIPSRCIFDYLKRNHVTILDLALVLKQDPADINQRVQQQRQLVANYIQLLNELSHYEPGHNCTKCGILRSSPGICLNTENCARRVALYDNQIKLPPYSLFKLNLSRADFYRLFAQPQYASLLGDSIVDPATLTRAHRQQMIVKGDYTEPEE